MADLPHPGRCALPNRLVHCPFDGIRPECCQHTLLARPVKRPRRRPGHPPPRAMTRCARRPSSRWLLRAGASTAEISVRVTPTLAPAQSSPNASHVRQQFPTALSPPRWHRPDHACSSSAKSGPWLQWLRRREMPSRPRNAVTMTGATRAIIVDSLIRTASRLRSSGVFRAWAPCSSQEARERIPHTGRTSECAASSATPRYLADLPRRAPLRVFGLCSAAASRACTSRPAAARTSGRCARLVSWRCTPDWTSRPARVSVP